MYEGRAVTPDAAVTTAMAPALARVEALRAVPVGVALDARLRAAAAPTIPPLGNLFADALRDAVPGADAAIGYSAGPGGLRPVWPPVRSPRARSTTRSRSTTAWSAPS